MLCIICLIFAYLWPWDHNKILLFSISVFCLIKGRALLLVVREVVGYSGGVCVVERSVKLYLFLNIIVGKFRRAVD